VRPPAPSPCLHPHGRVVLHGWLFSSMHGVRALYC